MFFQYQCMEHQDRCSIAQISGGSLNALTLDYDTQILYWMDARLDKLESSNADGSNCRLLSTTQIYHSFGITFYQNRTDWHMNTIYSASISHPTQVSVVMRGLVLHPMGISVVLSQ